MICLEQYENDIQLFISPLLREIRVPHGFTTRIGGVSKPPFHSFNFQPVTDQLDHLAKSGLATSPSSPIAKQEDSVANVLNNTQRLADVITCTAREKIAIWQVHEDRIAQWNNTTHSDYAPPLEPSPIQLIAKADGLATCDTKALLIIRTADCVPILLATEDGKWVAAVHAGWRGVVANIIAKAAHLLAREAETTTANIIVAIGPCIGPDHFEVGQEVADEFQQADLSIAIRHFKPKPHIDLQQAIAHQLGQAGVPVDQIDGNTCCTFRDKDLFFSYRREQGLTGRMASVIGPR